MNRIRAWLLQSFPVGGASVSLYAPVNRDAPRPEERPEEASWSETSQCCCVSGLHDASSRWCDHSDQ
ncbi:hypothetical protein EYF80_025539 [Liparis tanakae]|uniref:Uncharacterized protein n=1 Tax=Liparis tanakae TaxID=230148 RepID=A0A4Z2HEI8_9TELE|nr:hypothetical protein EYF80_025539 [Liparis tanakae]